MNPLQRLKSNCGFTPCGDPSVWPPDHFHRWCLYIGILDSDNPNNGCVWKHPYSHENPPNAAELFQASSKGELDERYVTDFRVSRRLWMAIRSMQQHNLPPFHCALRRTAHERQWVAARPVKGRLAHKQWEKGNPTVVQAPVPPVLTAPTVGEEVYMWCPKGVKAN